MPGQQTKQSTVRRWRVIRGSAYQLFTASLEHCTRRRGQKAIEIHKIATARLPIPSSDRNVTFAAMPIHGDSGGFNVTIQMPRENCR